MVEIEINKWKWEKKTTKRGVREVEAGRSKGNEGWDELAKVTSTKHKIPIVNYSHLMTNSDPQKPLKEESRIMPPEPRSTKRFAK